MIPYAGMSGKGEIEEGGIGVKTIDVFAKEWFDRANGNSYFAGYVIVNYKMADTREFPMIFQYGYGDHYIDIAGQELVKAGEISMGSGEALWRYCDENNIILRTQKQENCKKRDVMQYSD